MNGLTILLIVFISLMTLWFVKVWREERRQRVQRKHLILD